MVEMMVEHWVGCLVHWMAGWKVAMMDKKMVDH